jgi:hypothetical protein
MKIEMKISVETLNKRKEFLTEYLDSKNPSIPEFLDYRVLYEVKAESIYSDFVKSVYEMTQPGNYPDSMINLFDKLLILATRFHLLFSFLLDPGLDEVLNILIWLTGNGVIEACWSDRPYSSYCSMEVAKLFYKIVQENQMTDDEAIYHIKNQIYTNEMKLNIDLTNADFLYKLKTTIEFDPMWDWELSERPDMYENRNSYLDSVMATFFRISVLKNEKNKEFKDIVGFNWNIQSEMLRFLVNDGRSQFMRSMYDRMRVMDGEAPLYPKQNYAQVDEEKSMWDEDVDKKQIQEEMEEEQNELSTQYGSEDLYQVTTWKNKFIRKPKKRPNTKQLTIKEQKLMEQENTDKRIILETVDKQINPVLNVSVEALGIIPVMEADVLMLNPEKQKTLADRLGDLRREVDIAYDKIRTGIPTVIDVWKKIDEWNPLLVLKDRGKVFDPKTDKGKEVLIDRLQVDRDYHQVIMDGYEKARKQSVVPPKDDVFHLPPKPKYEQPLLPQPTTAKPMRRIQELPLEISQYNIPSTIPVLIPPDLSKPKDFKKSDFDPEIRDFFNNTQKSDLPPAVLWLPDTISQTKDALRKKSANWFMKKLTESLRAVELARAKAEKSWVDGLVSRFRINSEAQKLLLLLDNKLKNYLEVRNKYKLQDEEYFKRKLDKKIDVAVEKAKKDTTLTRPVFDEIEFDLTQSDNYDKITKKGYKDLIQKMLTTIDVIKLQDKLDEADEERYLANLKLDAEIEFDQHKDSNVLEYAKKIIKVNEERYSRFKVLRRDRVERMLKILHIFEVRAGKNEIKVDKDTAAFLSFEKFNEMQEWYLTFIRNTEEEFRHMLRDMNKVPILVDKSKTQIFNIQKRQINELEDQLDKKERILLQQHKDEEKLKTKLNEYKLVIDEIDKIRKDTHNEDYKSLEYQEFVNKLNRTNASLTIQLKKSDLVEKELASIRVKYEETVAKNIGLLSVQDNLQKEIAKLREDMVSFKKTTEQLDQTKNWYEEGKVIIAELRDRLKSRDALVEDYKKTIDVLKHGKETDIINEENSLLIRQNNELETKLKYDKQRLEARDIENKQLKEENTRLLKEKRTLREDFQRDRDRFEQELDRARVHPEIGRQQERIDAQRDIITDLQQMLRTKDKLIKDIEKSISAQIPQYIQERNQLIEEHDKKVKALEKELKKAKQKYLDNEVSREMVVNLENELEVVRVNYKREQQQHAQDIEVLRKDREEQIKMRELQLNRFVIDMITKDKTITELTEAKKKLQDTVAEERDMIKKLQLELDIGQSNMALYRRELERFGLIEEQKSQDDNHILDLEAKLSNVKRKLLLAEVKVKDQQKHIQSIQETLNESEQRKQELIEQYDDLDVTFHETHRENIKLRQRIMELSQELEKLTLRLNDAEQIMEIDKAEVKRLHFENQEYQDVIDFQKKRNLYLYKESTDLKEQIAQMEKEAKTLVVLKIQLDDILKNFLDEKYRLLNIQTQLKIELEKIAPGKSRTDVARLEQELEAKVSKVKGRLEEVEKKINMIRKTDLVFPPETPPALLEVKKSMTELQEIIEQKKDEILDSRKNKANLKQLLREALKKIERLENELDYWTDFRNMQKKYNTVTQKQALKTQKAVNKKHADELTALKDGLDKALGEIQRLRNSVVSVKGEDELDYIDDILKKDRLKNYYQRQTNFSLKVFKDSKGSLIRRATLQPYIQYDFKHRYVTRPEDGDFSDDERDFVFVREKGVKHGGGPYARRRRRYDETWEYIQTYDRLRKAIEGTQSAIGYHYDNVNGLTMNVGPGVATLNTGIQEDEKIPLDVLPLYFKWIGKNDDAVQEKKDLYDKDPLRNPPLDDVEKNIWINDNVYDKIGFEGHPQQQELIQLKKSLFYKISDGLDETFTIQNPIVKAQDFKNIDATIVSEKFIGNALLLVLRKLEVDEDFANTEIDIMKFRMFLYRRLQEIRSMKIPMYTLNHILSQDNFYKTLTTKKVHNNQTEYEIVRVTNFPIELTRFTPNNYSLDTPIEKMFKKWLTNYIGNIVRRYVELGYKNTDNNPDNTLKIQIVLFVRLLRHRFMNDGTIESWPYTYKVKLDQNVFTSILSNTYNETNKDISQLLYHSMYDNGNYFRENLISLFMDQIVKLFEKLEFEYGDLEWDLSTSVLEKIEVCVVSNNKQVGEYLLKYSEYNKDIEMTREFINEDQKNARVDQMIRPEPPTHRLLDGRYPPYEEYKKLQPTHREQEQVPQNEMMEIQWNQDLSIPDRLDSPDKTPSHIQAPFDLGIPADLAIDENEKMTYDINNEENSWYEGGPIDIEDYFDLQVPPLPLTLQPEVPNVVKVVKKKKLTQLKKNEIHEKPVNPEEYKQLTSVLSEKVKTVPKNSYLIDDMLLHDLRDVSGDINPDPPLSGYNAGNTVVKILAVDDLVQQFEMSPHTRDYLITPKQHNINQLIRLEQPDFDTNPMITLNSFYKFFLSEQLNTPIQIIAHQMLFSLNPRIMVWNKDINWPLIDCVGWFFLFENPALFLSWLGSIYAHKNHEGDDIYDRYYKVEKKYLEIANTHRILLMCYMVLFNELPKLPGVTVSIKSSDDALLYESDVSPYHRMHSYIKMTVTGGMTLLDTIRNCRTVRFRFRTNEYPDYKPEWLTDREAVEDDTLTLGGGCSNDDKIFKEYEVFKSVTQGALCLYECIYILRKILASVTLEKKKDRRLLDMMLCIRQESMEDFIEYIKGTVEFAKTIVKNEFGVNVAILIYHQNKIIWPNLDQVYKSRFLLILKDQHWFLVRNSPGNNHYRQSVLDIIRKKATNHKFKWVSREGYTLKPKIDKKPKNKKKKDLTMDWFWDVETFTNRMGHQQVYLICCISQESKHVFSGYSCIIDFLNFVRSLSVVYSNKSNHRLWSFNGSKFDMMFLIHEIINLFTGVEIIGELTCLKAVKILNSTFLDFHNVAPCGSLDKIARDWKVGITKTEFDYKKVNDKNCNDKEILDESSKYCLNDCAVLEKIFHKFDNVILEMTKKFGSDKRLEYMTITNLSVKIFTMFFLKINLKGLTMEHLPQFRSAYFGGYVNVFKKHVTSNQINYYDFNSSYPYVMTGDLPSELKGVEECYLTDTNFTTQKNCAYMVIYFKIKDSSIIAPLPCRVDGQKRGNGLVYVMESHQPCIRWAHEIKMMQERNILEKIIVTRIYRFEMSKWCKDYIDFCYTKRLESKEQKNDTGTTFYKLLMNSLSGKFGQKHEERNIYIPHGQLKEIVFNKSFMNKVRTITPLTDKFFELELEQENEPDSEIGSLVYIIGFITSMARINLLNECFKIGQDRIIYCDTDSIIAECELNNSDTCLGALKKENKEQIVEVICIGAKMYFYRYANNKYEFRLKGVKKNNKLLQDVDSVRKLFISFLEQGKVTLENTDTFKRFFGGVQILNIIKDIFCLDRRKFTTINMSRPFQNTTEYIEQLKSPLP